MALREKINNAKKVWSDSRQRLTIICLMIVAILALFIAVRHFHAVQNLPAGLSSAINVAVPQISSIPGAGEPTREYAKLQEQQNSELAAEAAKHGTAALPTLVRTTYVDSALTTNINTTTDGCSVEELTKAHRAGVKAEELRCRGCSLVALKGGGFTAGELQRTGFSAAELLAAGFNVDDLRKIGTSADELVAAHVAAGELLKAGYKPAILRAAGITAAALKQGNLSAADLIQAGYEPSELSAAGFSAQDLATAGISAISANCQIDHLQKLRAQGIGSDDLKNLNCGIAALRAAGFTAADLRAAGFSAAALKKGGFSTKDLKDAGFSTGELLAAGCSASDLKNLGVSASELLANGATVGDLRQAGFSAAELKNAGVGATALRDAGFSAEEMLNGGYASEALAGAGFSAGEIMRAGGQALANSDAMKVTGCKIAEVMRIKQAGEILHNPQQWGCSIKELKGLGFTPEELLAAGFTEQELAKNGFKIAAKTGSSKSDVNSATTQSTGCKVNELMQLKKIGVKLSTVKSLGCSADLLQKAGFSPAEITAITNVPQKDTQTAVTKSSIEELQALQAQQELTDQERQNLTRQYQGLMLSQANQLINTWNTVPAQQFVQSVNNANTSIPDDKGAAGSLNGTTANLTASYQYKVGDILFAVLDTEVNSDEDSPIMATVVSGPLKGAKVIGNFSLADKRLILKFSQLSVPYLTSSITFSAVAIDPSTSRTALASEVNNHYFLRYGTMLAAAFVSGLGDAFQTAGGQVQITPSGNITTMPTLSFAQKSIIGLGNMATQLNNSLNSTVARLKPTVRVHAGVSIGLLVMKDLAVPKN